MKAVIPAAGKGTRMGDSAAQSKGLLDLCGRPLIAHSLDGAVEFDVQEIVIVVAAGNTDIAAAIGQRYRSRPVLYVEQVGNTGLVDAMLAAAPLVEGDDIALLLADEVLIGSRRRKMLQRFNTTTVDALVGVSGKADPELIARNYDVRCDPRGRILSVVEKPNEPIGGVIGLGNCLFRGDVMSRARDLAPHPSRQQRELAGLIQSIVDNGGLVESFQACHDYVNVNTSMDLHLARNLIAAATTGGPIRRPGKQRGRAKV